MTRIAAILWLVSLCSAFAWMMHYSATTSGIGSPPSEWPAASRLQLSRKNLTFLVFLHPHCPCSRATVSEVERILGQSAGHLQTTFLFVKPSGTDADWAMTSLWRSASEMPGATALMDGEGREASRFGIESSGTALLYSTNGTLIFAGGVTPERGHNGPNAGSDAILEALAHGSRTETRNVVFGCTVMDRECARESGIERQ